MSLIEFSNLRHVTVFKKDKASEKKLRCLFNEGLDMLADGFGYVFLFVVMVSTTINIDVLFFVFINKAVF